MMTNPSEFIERAKLVKAGDYESNVHNHLPSNLYEHLGVKFTQDNTVNAAGEKVRTLTFTHNCGASASFVVDVQHEDDETRNRVAAVQVSQ